MFEYDNKNQMGPTKFMQRGALSLIFYCIIYLSSHLFNLQQDKGEVIGTPVRGCTVLASVSLTLRAEMCQIFSAANLTTKFTINSLLRGSPVGLISRDYYISVPTALCKWQQQLLYQKCFQQNRCGSNILSLTSH